LNIGRNFDTPNKRAADDYLTCLSAVYRDASYVTVNISSPNTSGLRELQDGTALQPLLAALKAEQAKLSQKHGKYTPLVVKIAPDLSVADIERIARTLVKQRIDGVIAKHDHRSRTAACRTAASRRAFRRWRSTAAVRALAQALDGAMPISRRRHCRATTRGKNRGGRDPGADLYRAVTGDRSSSRNAGRWRSAN
jgi:dihydroorotate dehydrogenase